MMSQEWDSINYSWDWPFLLAFVRQRNIKVQPRLFFTVVETNFKKGGKGGGEGKEKKKKEKRNRRGGGRELLFVKCDVYVLYDICHRRSGIGQLQLVVLLHYCMSHILVMYHLLLPCTMIYPPSLGSL